MADFCKQCSIETFDKDFEELANLMPAEKYNAEEGIGALALCEGCGPVVVAIDGTCLGNCMNPEHGTTQEGEAA